ncbi:glycosyltransferase family 1 protein [Polaribacter sp. KT 15]|uniref:glycosyltransferase family 1 protein n=1 Tax=Polaribacter sp. KT 15 TaxID=1896175 RepID=UPI00090B7D1A|nr:glycosyltransferase family 1 protein [Polaribacter sp. KT 15]SHN09838.1 Glycosyltransferase involved in cell wall bisynthesis [Polaribacter sp. KT 15]
MIKKKILFVVAEFFKGGAERYAYEIDRVLDKTKFEVTILCLNNKNQKIDNWERFYDKKHSELGTKIIFCDNFLNIERPILNKIKRKLKIKTKGRINHKAMISFLSKFDILHWMGEYTFYHNLPDSLLRKSIVNTMSAKFQNPSLYDKFNFDTNYTFMSGFSGEEFKYEYGDFTKIKHYFFPLVFKIENEKPKWNFLRNPDIKKIGIFTRLDKYKPLDPFFYAFQLLLSEDINVELHVFGSGDPEEEGMNIKLKNLDISEKVFFRGHQEDITKTAIEEQLNLSWFQGYNNNRPAGYAGFDICSVGLPLICWDFFHEKIKEENYIYPHYKNLKKFVEHSLKIINNKEEAIKLSRLQFNKVKDNRDSLKYIKKLERIYNEINVN